MAKKIKIRVFNTLELNNVMVSGWYSYKDNPNKRYGLFTGATEGLEIEREADCMKFMKPNVGIISKNLWQIHIKVRHCDYDLMYEHEYKNWTDNICIAWLRSGNLGGDTVNWFFNGKKDCWYNGGKKGEELVVSHRVTCGNIPPSVGLENQSSEQPNDTEEKENEGYSSPSGGHYIRPGSESNSSPSGGHYIRPGSESSSSPSGGHYIRPGSESTSSNTGGSPVTSKRLYPTGKGSILAEYMNEDGSQKEHKRLYPTPLGWGGTGIDSNLDDKSDEDERRYYIRHDSSGE